MAGVLQQRLVALAGLAQVLVEVLEDAVLGLAPADASRVLVAHGRGLLGAGEGGVDLEQGAGIGVLGLAGLQGVGLDLAHQLEQLLLGDEQRDGVVVALGHLAPVEAVEHLHLLVHRRLGQGEELPLVEVVEAPGHVAGHLDVLDLVTPHRHLVGVEHQDVGGHQHRVAEQAHGDALVRILVAGGLVLGHRRLVGMGAVHQPLGADAGEHPGQLGDLGDVRLAIEDGVVGIQAQGQPGGGDLQARLLHPARVLALDQRMQVGEEVVGLDVGVLARLDGGLDGADIVAEVGSTGGGDAGENAGLLGSCTHGVSGLCDAEMAAMVTRGPGQGDRGPLAYPSRSAGSTASRPKASATAA